MAIATGVVNTEGILADEKIADMQNRFRLLNPDEEQFYMLLSKLPSQPAHRERVNWLEDELFPNVTTISATAVSSADQPSVAVATGTGEYFRVGDNIRFAASGEIAEVTGVTSDAVGLLRGVGSVAAASANSGTEIVIIGNASAQGADYGTLKVNLRTLGFNYTQIFRNPFGFTNTQIEIDTYGAGDPANEAAKKLVEHKRSLNNSCWLGGRDFDSGSAKGWMGGIVSEFISTNRSNAVGALSQTALEQFTRGVLQNGTMNKVVFASPIAASALSKLMNDDWVQAPPDTKFYGAHVNAFVSGCFGSRVPVITEKSWGRETNSANGRGGWMAMLDIAYIKKRPLNNRGTRLLRNRQGNGVDSQVSEYLTEMSLEVAVEKAHGLMQGITGAAA